MKRFLPVLFIVLFSTQCFADGSQDRYARRLNRQVRLGVSLHHALFNRGPAEVVYRSSGKANKAAAMQWWMNSPPHRALIEEGKIHQIICTGKVCVGR